MDNTIKRLIKNLTILLCVGAAGAVAGVFITFVFILLIMFLSGVSWDSWTVAFLLADMGVLCFAFSVGYCWDCVCED